MDSIEGIKKFIKNPETIITIFPSIIISLAGGDTLGEKLSIGIISFILIRVFLGGLIKDYWIVFIISFFTSIFFYEKLNGYFVFFWFGLFFFGILSYWLIHNNKNTEDTKKVEQ